MWKWIYPRNPRLCTFGTPIIIIIMPRSLYPKPKERPQKAVKRQIFFQYNCRSWFMMPDIRHEYGFFVEFIINITAKKQHLLP